MTNKKKPKDTVNRAQMSSLTSLIQDVNVHIAIHHDNVKTQTLYSLLG